LLCGAAAILAAPASAQPCPGPGHGLLLVHGGGGAREIYVNMGLELCGGPAARVLVVGEAGGEVDLASSEERLRLLGRWQAAGATNARILDLDDPPGAIAAIAEADYIFFAGGDQEALVDWMNRFPDVLAAIRQRHAEGALIGGASAGAAAMSARMIAGGDSASLTSIRSGGTALVPGLAFWPEVITDQHFIRRQRFARLISAVLDNPGLPGVAIDEETAVLVSPSDFKVLGNGVVTVFDARRARVQMAEPGRNQSATGINMSVLRAGDRFVWRDGPGAD
jgi:cyanophycinase